MTNSLYDQLQQSRFSVALLRDVALPIALGHDHANLEYWLGKQMARQLPVSNEEQLPIFTEQAEFGTLAIHHTRRKTITATLTGDIVASRLAAATPPSFALETGWLAQEWQMLTNIFTEGTYSVQKGTVLITLHQDAKEPVLTAEQAQADAITPLQSSMESPKK
ncbi:DUF2507 domain-containing protein [Schleiferilactobacillus perolens]|jgi:hypothetical protein|uniref:DUF2507 domain-containing protein n=1 Tax=Schleiferilactobacillus perolens DSM 12744 TaxID=1423792 RepID=A0A0R1N4X4_9LACO|nr:DUF2507 domain-containing protein [Schleiferilactobacillus perolens]KRL12837.1 hypothetical protein FD09_GL002376 [Schleiferilactobacillus perolens DSM 12744]MCI2171585.1 YslB family protein [Schleiferilactobacillus perolens]